MNDLKRIVLSFSKEESNQLVSYLQKKNKRQDTKNIQLLKLLRRSDLNSNDICLQLYSNNSKGAYHALRKRLFQSIIHFSANSSLENENSLQMEVIRYILAARNFLEQKQYNVAYKILNKAEITARVHHLFPLLNEIYHTQIQYAYAYPKLDLNTVIEKFNSNKEKHQLEAQLNIVYSKIKHQLANNDSSDFQTILYDILQEFGMDISKDLSFKSLYQLISIVTVSAFATNAHLNIETFLIEKYHTILSYKDQEKQPYYHIQILYHIANTLFRNKKFVESQHYLNQMHQLMHQHKSKYYNTFKLKYYLLLALNYNFSNQQIKAITLLKPFLNVKHQDIVSVLDIKLSMVMFHFQNNDLKQAYGILSKFYHSDKWYTEKTDMDWVIKKNLIEILLHIELGNIDLVESKFLSFKRQHYPYLQSINQDRAITYLELIEAYYMAPEQVTTQTFKNKVEHSFEWLPPQQEDIFVMSFYAWLKSKMDKAPLYKTTMDLVILSQTKN
ncbi:hypothetical protein MHTCC0001_29540 [Flavobacteriaceae bacterium MHTCC 0001]